MSEPASKLPPTDMETYVPAAITVVRRSRGWPGIFLQERRGKSGAVNYPSGIRQHILYLWLRALDGELVTEQGRNSMHYAAGEARFTPAGPPVAFRWHGDVHVLMLGFEGWFLERVAAELGCAINLPGAINTATLPAIHPAATLVRQLAQELEAGPGSSVVADGIARAVAVLLLRQFQRLPPVKSPPAAPPAAVLRAVTLMRRRLADSLSLDELAKAAALSPFHFSRQFKTATGHPPHEYLIRLRVDRAQELLRQHGRTWNMAAVAREVGFSDQSHLARHFKRVLGITPSEFVN
ncbi:MAG TPA: AraC family transcriptional regulator [Verrucomicrobiota bacterium]|nr:hypothetical protein [Verrucomicrobiales bacterium]HRI11595.1 AraC family transcriptional regulator [Verrucomicrobiota bacterium]